MNIKPLQDKVVVRIEAAATESKGGIALLQAVETDGPLRGEVVAVGPGKYNDAGIREPLEVVIGDIVAFPKAAGQKFEELGVTIMLESEIITVVG